MLAEPIGVIRRITKRGLMTSSRVCLALYLRYKRLRGRVSINDESLKSLPKLDR